MPPARLVVSITSTRCFIHLLCQCWDLSAICVVRARPAARPPDQNGKSPLPNSATKRWTSSRWAWSSRLGKPDQNRGWQATADVCLVQVVRREVDPKRFHEIGAWFAIVLILPFPEEVGD